MSQSTNPPYGSQHDDLNSTLRTPDISFDEEAGVSWPSGENYWQSSQQSEDNEEQAETPNTNQELPLDDEMSEQQVDDECSGFNFSSDYDSYSEQLSYFHRDDYECAHEMDVQVEEQNFDQSESQTGLPDEMEAPETGNSKNGAVTIGHFDLSYQLTLIILPQTKNDSDKE